MSEPNGSPETADEDHQEQQTNDEQCQLTPENLAQHEGDTKNQNDTDENQTETQDDPNLIGIGAQFRDDPTTTASGSRDNSGGTPMERWEQSCEDGPFGYFLEEEENNGKGEERETKDN